MILSALALKLFAHEYLPKQKRSVFKSMSILSVSFEPVKIVTLKIFLMKKTTLWTLGIIIFILLIVGAAGFYKFNILADDIYVLIIL